MLNFQPQRPQAVQSGSHTQPQGGGGFNFWDAIGGAGQGYLQGGVEGAISGFAGNAIGGGGGGQTTGPITTNAPTSGTQNNQALQNSDQMMLQSQQMTPGLGQDMNSMAPENRIGGNQTGVQNADTMMQAAMADPYINPHLWEL